MHALSLLLIAALGFTEQRLGVDGRTLWVETGDFNHDSATDLLVCYRRGVDPDTRRVLAFFLEQDGRYPEKPQVERPVPADASFAAIADENGDGADDVLLLTGQGVSAYLGEAGGVTALQELLRAPTVTPFAELEDLPIWPFGRDWHGDGHFELAIWRTGSLSFYRRESSGTFTSRETIQIVPQTWTDSSRGGFFRGPYSNRNLSIQVTHVFAELQTGDYDGDGRVDLFAANEDRLTIYKQSADGRFAPTPSVKLDFGVRTSEERQRKNAYVSGHSVDLNGDGKLDHVINKISGGLSSMKSETHIHLNQGGGFKKSADQVIRRDGFSALVQFIDLDGDNKPDLVEPSTEIGVFMLARALVSKKIGVEWLISSNHRGTFDVAQTRRVSVVFGLDFEGGAMFRGPYPNFAYDYNGDGHRDFMTSPDGEEVTIYFGRGDGSFDPEPSLRVSADASPYTAPYADKKTGRTNIVSYFRDMPGKEGLITVLRNRASP